jgi:Bacterial Ig-like domain (group 2)
LDARIRPDPEVFPSPEIEVRGRRPIAENLKSDIASAIFKKRRTEAPPGGTLVPSARSAPCIILLPRERVIANMMLIESLRCQRGRGRCARTWRRVEVLEDRILLADGINPSPGPPITGAPGVAVTNAVVATYTIADPSGNPGTKWRAKVAWGDNTSDDKKLAPTQLPDGSFEFLDSHTYATAGTYTVTVNIAVPGSHKPNDNTVTTTATIKAQTTLSSIAVTPANPSVPKGLTEQFTATGTFSDGSMKDLTSQVTWASAMASVATISNAAGSQGLATAVAIGTSSISATLGGISGSTVLTVTAAALQSIAVTPAGPSVPKGLTEQFTATGTYSDSSTQDLTSQVTWASATTSVATITTAGLATAVGTGTSTISAALGGISGSTVLTVTAAVLQSIAVTPANPSVTVGQTEPFLAMGTYSDNSTQDLTAQVTWASSDTTVATISNASGSRGLATAVAIGRSTITATLEGISGATTITVTQIPTLSPVAAEDNSQAGYYQYGAWTTASGGYNGTYEVANPTTSATASNRWVLIVLAGTYDFYATWVAGASNATNTGYSVYDGFTKLGSFQANQQQAPSDGQYGSVLWAKLGTITVTNGRLTIAMSASGANGEIVADGILLTASGTSITTTGTGGSTGGSTSPPTTTPMGPTSTSNSSGTDQGGGGTSGTSSSTPVVVSPQGPAAASGSSITVNYSGDSASSNADIPSSPSLTDHAIAEMGKGHRHQHHQAIVPRLARRGAAHSHVTIRERHPER